MRRREKSGFTLIELVITVLVIGILMALAVPIVRGQTSRVMAGEAEAAAGAIRAAQRVWFAEHSAYTDNWEDLSAQVDMHENKYFNSAPTLTASGGNEDAKFTATLTGSGDAAGITVSITEAGNVAITGI